MRKDAAVNVRLETEKRESLQLLADHDDRELAAYIRRVLDGHLTGKADLVAELRGKAGDKPRN
jgi:predicted DNA-binding protein